MSKKLYREHSEFPTAGAKLERQHFWTSFFISALIVLGTKKFVEPWLFSDWAAPWWAYLIYFIALWGFGMGELAKSAATKKAAYGEKEQG